MSRGWTPVRLASVASLDALTATPADLSDDDLYIGLENIGPNGELIGLGDVRATSLRSNKNRFTSNDVLFGKLRPYLTKVARPTGAGVCSTDILVLRPSDALDRDYLYWWLRSPTVIEDATARSTGATLPRISPSTLGEFEIPVPPLAEQQRIVAKLDEVMALGDLLQDRSALERARSEELRQRMTVELMESSGPLVSLGGLCEVLDSKRQPITKKDRAPGPIPYYGATGVVDYVRDFIFDEDLVLLGEDGAKWGPGDRSAFAISGRTWVNNHAHVLRPDRKVVRDQWLIEYLNAVDLGDYVTGLTVPKLNQAQMRSIPVPVPTLAVQDELLSRLDAVFELSGRLSQIAATRKTKVGELRRSVLAAAFRGDL